MYINTLEEDPVDYPADGGDEGDDEDESSDDDEDDDIDIERDEEEDESSDDDIDIKRNEEEDEYLAPADSTAVALPAVDHASSAEETDPFRTDDTPQGTGTDCTKVMSDSADYSSRMHSDLKGRQSPSTARVRDDLYKFVDTVERGEGSTPAAMERRNRITRLYKEPESTAHRKVQALTALKSCQTQLTTVLGRIQILKVARVPAQPEEPEREVVRSSHSYHREQELIGQLSPRNISDQ
nr:hypothetical protein [Tanacetum cinerariifolium]